MRALTEETVAFKKFPKTKGSMPYLPLGSEWEEYLTKVNKWRVDTAEKLQKFLNEWDRMEHETVEGIKLLKQLLEALR